MPLYNNPLGILYLLWILPPTSFQLIHHIGIQDHQQSNKVCIVVRWGKAAKPNWTIYAHSHKLSLNTNTKERTNLGSVMYKAVLSWYWCINLVNITLLTSSTRNTKWKLEKCSIKQTYCLCSLSSANLDKTSKNLSWPIFWNNISQCFISDCWHCIRFQHNTIFSFTLIFSEKYNKQILFYFLWVNS